MNGKNAAMRSARTAAIRGVQFTTGMAGAAKAVSWERSSVCRSACRPLAACFQANPASTVRCRGSRSSATPGPRNERTSRTESRGAGALPDRDEYTRGQQREIVGLRLARQLVIHVSENRIEKLSSAFGRAVDRDRKPLFGMAVSVSERFRDAVRVQQHVIAVVQGEVTYSITADRLTLRSGDIGLDLRANP